jgi:methylated-DNA-[protein]-cysteine S-methyltransferase
MLEIYTKNIDGAWFAIACSQQKVVTTSFGETQHSALNHILSNLPYNMSFQVLHKPTNFAETTITVLKTIYDGKDIDLNLHLDTADLSVYTWKVLKITSKIPVGYVSSYGAISKVAGGSPRAVGNVMAANPFVPIVPCHRVVKSDLTLGNYGGGKNVKFELLRRERRGFTTSKTILLNDKKLQVFPVELVLKNLTQTSAWANNKCM